jgi:hypothetical protein
MTNRRIVTHGRTPWGRPVVYIKEAERIVVHVPGSRLPEYDDAPTGAKLTAWWIAAACLSVMFWGGLFLLLNLTGWGSP